MRIITCLLALLITCDAAFGQKLGEVTRLEPSADAPGGEVLEWTTPEGQEYWYRLPKKARRGYKPRLILMLHGTGLNHGWSFWNYPIASGQFRGDDIVISPDGLTPGAGSTFNFLQTKKDGEQIVNLIAYFREHFEISNVYLYGHSQGAFFCYWFAGEYPELVDGIVAHAGNVLDVKHSKLSRNKVSIGILHARSDPVVSVECAERSERIYREEGYRKLKCWIVEDIRPEAGHWPLPRQVSEMFEWLDQVSIASADQALDVARSALRGDTPNFALAARASAEAGGLLKSYRGDDKQALASLLDDMEGALAACSDAAWAQIATALEEHDGGKSGGTYAADVRWARRSFDTLEVFRASSKRWASLFKKHDKALGKLAKYKDKDGKKYARALLAALEKSYLATAWDTALSQAQRRVEDGWRPLDSLPASFGELASELGTAPKPEVLHAAHEALRLFAVAHPAILED